MVVTTQESLDGICEKAMRIASIDELGASSSAGRWFSLGAENEGTRKSMTDGSGLRRSSKNERNKKVNDIVSRLWVQE